MTEPYYSDEWVTLWHGDCREIALRLSVDLIVTDPPYGETSLAWDRWPDGWPTIAASCARSMWCFGSMRMFLDQRIQFNRWRLSQDVVWRKRTPGFNPGDRFNRVHEHALHWYHGDWATIPHTPDRVPAKKRQVGDLITRLAKSAGVNGAMGATKQESDGLAYIETVLDGQVARSESLHPTEKPANILEALIRYGSPLGGAVLDLFAGSGSTLDAARATGRKAIGIEADERYCEIAARRLAQGALDFTGGAA